MIDIKSLEIEEMIEFMLSISEKKYRAYQIYDWLHNKLVNDVREFKNIPKSLQDLLLEKTHILTIEEELVQESKIDGTKKFLFKLYDNNLIESVLMKYKYGYSLCISSQVGCRMGCTFCASTIDGLTRNLSASEMLEQVYYAYKLVDKKISNIVVMGAGEPLDNYDNLLKFIKIVSSKEGINISQRNITVSTCGIVPNINRLANEKLQITLALSLHAPNNEIRKRLMPISNKYKLDEVLEACRNYYNLTKRRVSYEYSLVAGVNDNKEEAYKLLELLKNDYSHINLIPVNPIKEREYKESSKKAIYEFKSILERAKKNVTIRRELGRDIDGACGQLRRRYKEEN